MPKPISETAAKRRAFQKETEKRILVDFKDAASFLVEHGNVPRFIAQMDKTAVAFIEAKGPRLSQVGIASAGLHASRETAEAALVMHSKRARVKGADLDRVMLSGPVLPIFLAGVQSFLNEGVKQKVFSEAYAQRTAGGIWKRLEQRSKDLGIKPQHG